MNEPRGNDAIVGALLCEPSDPACDAGVIFFNNVGYLNMCGHGTIGLVVTLAHLGRAREGTCRIETVCGVVEARLLDANRVTIRNVPSYRSAAGVTVDAPGIGPVTGDVAWGGNWFFLDRRSRTGAHARPPRSPDRLRVAHPARHRAAGRHRRATAASSITSSSSARPPRPGADSKSFVLCPGKAYDRSPCGTGTSAKLACLYADGKLRPGDVWRQESIVGSVFEGTVSVVDGQVIPEITGSAYVNAEADLILDERDPFCYGIRGACAQAST